MATRTKAASGRSARRPNPPVRQSVSTPAPLAAEVRRIAEQRHLTMSRALIALAERGVRAEQDEGEALEATYQRFLKERGPAKKDEAGQELIRAIFGKDAIAEDPVL